MFIPVGLLGDRISRKPMLVIGALFSGVTFVGRSFLETESSLLSLAVLSGLFVSIVQVLAIPFLAENVSKSKRLKMFSYYSSIVLAAQILGSMGGGVLGDLLQASGISRISSLQTVLFIGGTAILISFVPLLFITEVQHKEAVPSPPTKRAEPNQNPIAASVPSSDRKIIGQFVITQLLIGFGSGLVIPYLNLYFTNRFDTSLSAMSLLISLGQIMTIVSMLIGPSLAERIGPVKAVVGFQILSLPFLLLTGFTNLFIVAAISFLFRQALMNAANPLQSSILIERVSDKRRGIANSMMQTAFMVGWATMGPVQSYFVTTYGSYWGYAITFSITGMLYVVSSLLYFFMFRERPSMHHVLHKPDSRQTNP